VIPLAALPAGVQPWVAVSPSFSYGKACVAFGSGVAAPFGTEPIGAPVPVALPIASSLFRVVGN
jgi:hypothetical protein